MKFHSLLELYAFLPKEEAGITDILRQITIEIFNGYGKEKLSYNVPFFYGNRSICLIYPASVPRSGVKNGVLFGFWYGNRLVDVNNYLDHGTNKQIFYKVYCSVDEIDVSSLRIVLEEAIELDKKFKPNSRKGRKRTQG